MEKANPAVFQLISYSIPKFSFEEPQSQTGNIDIQIHPSGIYNTSSGEFFVVIAFLAISVNKDDKEDKKTFVEIGFKATFKIEGKPAKENIPEFFYQNCLAIVFPYLRAFLSNMTLQAGVPLIILPLLNLTHLSAQLKENIEVFE